MERHWVVINLQLNEWPKPSYEGAGPAKAALFPLHVTTRKVAVAICWYLCTFTQGNDKNIISLTTDHTAFSCFSRKKHPFGLVLPNKVKNLIKLNLNLFTTKFSFVKFSDSTQIRK